MWPTGVNLFRFSLFSFVECYMLVCCTFKCRFQQLQSERNQLAAKVDQIRDIAIELINSSKKHEHLVESQLIAFNQRWQDLDEAFKVGRMLIFLPKFFLLLLIFVSTYLSV